MIAAARTPRYIAGVIALACLAAMRLAHAAEPTDPATRVVIEAKPLSEIDERRYSTAAKSIYGREELDRHGDSSVTEVLKRLPGVTVSGTPGRGGDVRMRGLGKGYTLLLLNGEPIPPGFSLDDLAPDQVERIEVTAAPVAEQSARAIAGTINIVLREAMKKTNSEARLELGDTDRHLQPGVFLQRNDHADALTYNLSANVNHRDLTSESTTRTAAVDTTIGAPTLQQSQRDTGTSISDRVHLGGRFDWNLDGGDKLLLQPFVFQMRNHGDGASTLEQALGAGSAPYATAQSHSEGNGRYARIMAELRRALEDGARLELRANAGQWAGHSTSTRDLFDAAGAPTHTISNESDVRDTTVGTSGKFSRGWQQDHRIAAGWEVEFRQRREAPTIIEDGANVLGAYGDHTDANSRRLALYAQDEWDVTPQWALYGGLRGETIHIGADAGGRSIANTGTVVSPLVHTVWRFTPEARDQVRMSLTRSYRSPYLSDLTSTPGISPNYPVSGTNTPTDADAVGNPGLRPELAWGLDLALEHYLGNGGILSASVFHRNIDNVVRNVTALQTVDWSAQPRWVSMPRNLGNAVSQGIELEAKFRLDEWLAGAPPIDLRLNYSRYWSKVSTVPGPDNRLDQQPKQTANVGADYRFASLPLAVGGSLNWTPAYAVRQTESQFYYQGVKRVVDIYALWKIAPDTRLRFSVSNCLHQDYQTATRELFGGTDQTATTVRTTYPNFAARLEIGF